MAQDPHREITRVLARIDGIALIGSRQMPWWSATFCGLRHQFLVRIDSPAGKAALDAIASHEFTISGHLVADIAIVAEPVASGSDADSAPPISDGGNDDAMVHVEALTLAEA